MASVDNLGLALGELSTAIKTMNCLSVPLPCNFDKNYYHSIEDFFYFFEKYCLSIYGNDKLSWLQVLPNFLVGEPRNIVQSFGLGKNLMYDLVRDRLIRELNIQDISCNEYSQFIATRRSGNESVTCFMIRLEIMAGKTPNIDNANKQSLVRFKFLSSLSTDMGKLLNVHAGHLDSISNEQIARLVVNLEQQEVSIGKQINDESCELLVESYAISPTDTHKPVKRIKCFRCGIFGHIRPTCCV